MAFIFKSLGLPVIFYILFLAEIGNGQLGNGCWSTPECNSPLLQCVNFVCICWPPYVPNIENTRCAVDINGRCERVQDICVDPNASCNETLSIWDSSWCNCNEGFLQDTESKLCQPSLGSPCDTNGLPCVAGSCIDETCQCGAGLAPSQNNDECGIVVGGTCSTANPSCADPFAECSSNTNICQCKEGYQSVVENGSTICKVALGASCELTSQCAPLNTTCEVLMHGNGACTCVPTYVPSIDRTSCLPVTTHWPGICQENLQCSTMFGRYSSCRNNVCVCTSGYIYVADDFGCVPLHTAVEPRIYESVKLLAITLLPYLPEEGKLAVEEILNKL